MGISTRAIETHPAAECKVTITIGGRLMGGRHGLSDRSRSDPVFTFHKAAGWTSSGNVRMQEAHRIKGGNEFEQVETPEQPIDRVAMP